MATIDTIWRNQGEDTVDDDLRGVGIATDGTSVWGGYNTTMFTTTWLAIKLDEDGNEIWTWEDDIQGASEDLLYTSAICQDESVVLAGSFDGDFRVVKLDADSSVVWRRQVGTAYTDVIHGIAVGDDGSVVAAGKTFGSWYASNTGGSDMAAFKLDADGTLLWKWQHGTDIEWANDVSMADDGSVVIVGVSSGELVEVYATSLESSFFPPALYNFVAFKLDSEGAEVWRWQEGPRGEPNNLMSVSTTEDGSYILAGNVEGVWSVGESAGGLDFVAVMLDVDGNEVWSWQDGTSGNDYLRSTAVQADGTILLGGYTEGDWYGTNTGGFDIALVALDADGEEIWRWQDGSTAVGTNIPSDFVSALSVGADGRLAVAGATYGVWATPNGGGLDFMATMLDTGALATQATTPAPTTASNTAPTTSATTPGPTAALNTPPTTPAPTPAPTPALNTPPTTPATTPTPTPPSNTAPTTPATTPAPTPDPLPSPSPGVIRTTPSGPTQTASNVTPILAGVGSGVAGAALIVFGLCLLKRHTAKKKGAAQQVHPPVVAVDRGNGSRSLQRDPLPPPPPYSRAVAEAGDIDGGGRCVIFPAPAALAGVIQRRSEPTTHASNDGGGGGGVSLEERDTETTTHADKYRGGGIAAKDTYGEPTTYAGDGGSGNDRIGRKAGNMQDGSAQPALVITTSTANISTGERDELAPAYSGGSVKGAAFVADKHKLTLNEIGASSPTDRRGPSNGFGLCQAIGDTARELARNCQIPGVVEVAAAVSVLVDLVTDNQNTKSGTEASLKRCRSIVNMLERAAKVLGRGGETTGKAERAMIEDVHDAIFDLVELIKTYQSKNRLSQVLMSTLFRRRQEEMGAVVDKAILNLQLGLNVQVGNDVRSVKHAVGAFKDDIHLYKGSMEEAQSKSLAEARKARRQRKLDQLQIPEDHVAITDELLGKGGFGEVYLADYNGHNAAAKVVHISNDLARNSEIDLDGSTRGQVERRRVGNQRKAFLLELDAMIRLRSPYTVNVYGAVTGMHDRLVLLMELLSGGDLGTLLSNCEHPLPKKKSCQIIGDICAGMAFLHSKEFVHGDLKSANVLLDGAGRAKIGDFGTSRWMKHTMSTGLATLTTKSSKNTQMSLAWSAPEVLNAAGSTYPSDVYSFGVVVWEVLSRELPWATVTHPRDVYIRVVLNGLRPVIPDDAPTEIADVARSCWVGEPRDRPTFSALTEGMRSNHWNE